MGGLYSVSSQFISDERGELSIKTEWFVFPQPCLLSFPSYNLEYLSYFFSRTIPTPSLILNLDITLSEKHSLGPPLLHVPTMEYKHISPHTAHCNTGNCSLVSFTCCYCVCVLSRVWLFVTPWMAARQSPLSMEFSRQEYWSGLPCLSPGDFPDLGIKPVSLASPALADGLFYH